jgi:hypothetical protein
VRIIFLSEPGFIGLMDYSDFSNCISNHFLIFLSEPGLIRLMDYQDFNNCISKSINPKNLFNPGSDNLHIKKSYLHIIKMYTFVPNFIDTL